MLFSLSFVVLYFHILWQALPILVFLVLLIGGQGWWLGRREGWSLVDSLYFSFVTATTVGYGDLHPTHRRSKVQAILIAFSGVVLTGLMVSLAIEAVREASEMVKSHSSVEETIKSLEKIPGTKENLEELLE